MTARIWLDEHRTILVMSWQDDEREGMCVTFRDASGVWNDALTEEKTK